MVANLANYFLITPLCNDSNVLPLKSFKRVDPSPSPSALPAEEFSSFIFSSLLDTWTSYLRSLKGRVLAFEPPSNIR